MISFSFFIVDVLNNRRGLYMVLDVRVPALALSGSKQTGKPLCRQSPARAHRRQLNFCSLIVSESYFFVYFFFHNNIFSMHDALAFRRAYGVSL